MIIKPTYNLEGDETSSKITLERIQKNFDFMTSEAYYAGSDELLDSVFIGNRKGDRIFLINRPAKVNSVFTTVFRGKIICHGDSCYIKGRFGKRYFDYFLFAVLSVIVMLFAREMMEFSSSTEAIGVAIIWGIVTILFFFTTKKVKFKYISFLQRIFDMKNT